MNHTKENGSADILTQVLEEMKQEQGNKFDLATVNLADLSRRTGITRKKLRRLKDLEFEDRPHALTGRKAAVTVISGYTGIIDDLLRKGVTNSSVCFDRITECGYNGCLTQVKKYISEHKDLVPAKRQQVSSQGNRGRRYSTAPGEAFQMDWGFVKVDAYDGDQFQVACFAMICHHCGERYIEFFPNARQENLFIGMIHAFAFMGIPKYVLTDNMKSVVLHRDAEGHPVWQTDYECFMKTIGFKTKLCKPRHPFTKGAVERLIRFVKENFLAGRSFFNLSDLNEAALVWCDTQNKRYHRAVDCIPSEEHFKICGHDLIPLEQTIEVVKYLCPLRKITFDGFISYEGRRFGVPYWYTRKNCRIRRDKDTIYIYDDELTRILTSHPVTWSKKDSFCHDQYIMTQPEELPTSAVKTIICQKEKPRLNSGFEKFNFDKEDWI